MRDILRTFTQASRASGSVQGMRRMATRRASARAVAITLPADTVPVIATSPFEHRLPRRERSRAAPPAVSYEREGSMPTRVAAIEVSHWHSLYDSAYLRHLAAMADVEIVGLHDPSAEIAARRAAAVGGPPTFTDYRQMLAATRPDFVVALGRHRGMAEVAHHLLDHGLPFLMEKPMGIDAAEVRAVAEKAAARRGFAAVPLIQRYHPFAAHARRLLAEQAFGPLSHVYFRLDRPTSARYPAWDSPWMLDPAEAGGGCLRNLGSHGLDLFLFLTGEEAEVTGAQLGHRVHGQAVEDYASVLLRSRSGVLGTIEVGNTFPRDGTDADWTIAGRDALLRFDGHTLRLVTARGEESVPGHSEEPLARTALRDVLDHWRRGAPPPISVHDCLRTAHLIDQAYALAGPPALTGPGPGLRGPG
jgi:predicted dehydrogenase